MPEVIDRGWEHKKAISPLPLGGFRDPGSLARSVLVDAANDGHRPVHFVQRHLQNAPLLLEGQRRHLRGVGVGGDAGHPWRVDQVPQMPAVVLLVDLQLCIESHQIGGYDTPENQLRPHWKTSPRSRRGGYSSIPTTFTDSPVSETRALQRVRRGHDLLRSRIRFKAKPKGWQ